MKHNFRNLEVWKKVSALVKTVYIFSSKLPNDEKYGLQSQLKRASVCVPSNIAEGRGRNGNKELIQFCNIAIGSLCEIETQLFLCQDLDLAKPNEVKTIISNIYQVRRMTLGFITTLKSR